MLSHRRLNDDILELLRRSVGCLDPAGRAFAVRDYNVEEYPCYYKRTSGWKLESLRGRVVVTFNLTLEFTVFRMDGIDYLLATEAGELVVTEDGEYYIDLNIYAD